ncbi:MAG: 16S rRNA (uracil(1498)-N(3))-methyltransferase [Solobacterium sp.]|nr:16S rRNA (uracil(1498)-N(3))-methyltransferase [Solobacterium sp.]
MQEYFVEETLSPGKIIELPKDKADHAFKVLRLSHEMIRLVSQGTGWFAEAYQEGKKGLARVISRDPDINELPVDFTLCMALIRREKFELVLQKAAELGVSKIVPFVSSRCVVKAKEEKSQRQLERWRAILTEASEQCKRNRIPDIVSPLSVSDLDTCMQSVNLCAYEGVRTSAVSVSGAMKPEPVTAVIGPEGGFSEDEVKLLETMGYTPVSLGNRILRAETAAIYICSVIGEALM